MKGLQCLCLWDFCDFMKSDDTSVFADDDYILHWLQKKWDWRDDWDKLCFDRACSGDVDTWYKSVEWNIHCNNLHSCLPFIGCPFMPVVILLDMCCGSLGQSTGKSLNSSEWATSKLTATLKHPANLFRTALPASSINPCWPKTIALAMKLNLSDSNYLGYELHYSKMEKKVYN